MGRAVLLACLTGLLYAPCLKSGMDNPAGPHCPPREGLALQVLGSGGPIADDARASSSYLVWMDGKARVLVDAGSGGFLRFGESGAQFEDLDLVALSHYHTDHSADLPALLKSGYFSSRQRSLAVSGPSAGEPFPGLREFLAGLLSRTGGSFRYLSGYLDGSGGLVAIDPIEVDHQRESITTVYGSDGLTVKALGVPHGIVPAVAYRVDMDGHSIVFGTDQKGGTEPFTEFARNADILVAHAAIPENAGRGARSLHATPSAIGLMARAADPGKLVLSHFMARSLVALDESLELIGEQYDGDIELAEDLACFTP